MVRKTRLYLIICINFLLLLTLLNAVFAMQPPCSEDQLLKSASFVVEGKVLNKICESPYTGYQGEECYTLITNCSNDVEVIKNIKGNYSVGDIITYNSTSVTWHSVSGNDYECAMAGPMGFGSFAMNVGDTIRYYHHPTHPTNLTGGLGGMDCPNYIEVITRAPEPISETPEPNGKEISTSPNVFYLVIPIAVIIIIVIFLVLRKKK